jgi:DNA ligase (NAD+)
MSLSQQTQHLQQLATTSDLTTLSPIKDLYQSLIDNLTEHNHLYYVQAKPIISDTEYDQLFEFLEKIETEFPYLISSNSPTQSLIGQIAEGFTKANHQVPLLSLENSYTAADLLDFDERVKKMLIKNDITDYHYTIEPKYDGLSVELLYQDGELVKAITRGDGRTGEDITTNVKTIKNLPKRLYNAPAFLSVRGEIMMPKSVWKTLNAQRQQAGKELFANTRNAAAGSIKLLDSGEVAKRNLFCFVYDLLYAENADGQRIDCAITDFPFPQVALNTTPSDIHTIQTICLDPAMKAFLDSQDFDFDGLVIKVAEHRTLLGETNHHPRRSIAYKFPAEQASTQILSIDFQVGRSGMITPVANLQPVKLSGAEISRVSLHNFDFIRQKEIKKADFVRVQRSGEVIPHITGVIKERRTGNEELIEMPLFCPSCQSPVLKIGVFYYCANPDCPAQVKEKILHFVSKNCMDIQWIGEGVIDVLVDNGILHNVADVYKLEDAYLRILLRKFPGFGDKKIYEITKQVKASKKQPLRRIINALGIPHVGDKTSQDIATLLQEQKADGIEKIQSILTNADIMITVPGIGEKTILTLQTFFSNPQTQELLKKLQQYGIPFSAVREKKQTKTHQGTFAITGIFPLSRDQIKETLEKS